MALKRINKVTHGALGDGVVGGKEGSGPEEAWGWGKYDCENILAWVILPLRDGERVYT